MGTNEVTMRVIIQISLSCFLQSPTQAFLGTSHFSLWDDCQVPEPCCPLHSTATASTECATLFWTQEPCTVCHPSSAAPMLLLSLDKADRAMHSSQCEPHHVLPTKHCFARHSRPWQGSFAKKGCLSCYSSGKRKDSFVLTTTETNTFLRNWRTTFLSLSWYALLLSLMFVFEPTGKTLAI